MDNLVLLKEFRGHYWQMTTAQGWAAWVFGWKHDSHQNHQNRAVAPPERQKEMAGKYTGCFGFVLQWEGVGRNHSSSFMSKSEMLENVSNPSDIHLWVICLRFSVTHRHTEANHTFFSFLVFSNTCTFILDMMEVSCRFLQNFCNYLYNCSAFIQLVYYYSWLLHITLAKLYFIYFLLIMEAIQVNINQKQP